MNSADRISRVLLAACAVLTVGLSIGSSDYFRVALGSAMLFGLLAASTDVSFGYAGILNLGSALFFGIGAYGVALGQSAGIPFIGSVTLSLLVGGVMGFALGWIGLTHGRTSIQFGLLGLVLSLSFEQIIISNYETLGGSNGVAGVRLPGVGGEPLTILSYVLLLCSVTFPIIWMLLNCRSNNYGRLLLLARDEPEKAEAMGHDVKAIKIYAVVVSSIFATLAGSLYAPLIGIAYPALFSVAPNMLVLIWVIIGGRATVLGPFFGALLFKMIEFEAGSRFSNFYTLIVAILFLFTILVLPDGLMSLTRAAIARRK